MRRPSIAVAFMLSLAVGADLRAQTGTEATPAAIVEELRSLAPLSDQMAPVRGLTLRRDAAVLRLEQGTLHLLTPVAGRTVGALFLGTGTFTVTPPLAVERRELLRLLGDSTFQRPITAAVLLFADSTLARLRNQFAFAAGQSADRRGPGLVKEAVEYLLDSGTRRIEPALLSSLLNQEPNEFWSIYVRPINGEDVTVKFDPYDLEEVQLLRKGKLRGQRIQVVSQFQREIDLADSTAAFEASTEPLALGPYRIEATIGNNLGFQASAEVTITSRQGQGKWIPLELFHELKVDSVTGPGGRRQRLYRHEKSSELWVRLDPQLKYGETRTIRVAYQGELLARGSLMARFLPPPSDPRGRGFPTATDRWVFIKSTWNWFPRYGSRQRAHMELTFHTPEAYRFASIGRRVASTVAGRVRTTRWTTEEPTQTASFSLGEFSEFEVTDPRIPPVTVHMNVDAHRDLGQLFRQQEDPEAQVGRDVATSLAFFTSEFGALPHQQYYAAEIPYFHGQAFPGLIHLSWWTFQSVEKTGWEQIFRAHEMAHQWWGIGVEPDGYRDTWISEGFSMFAGLWYMQVALRDNEKYFKQLDEWRDEIRLKRNSAGPVSLGTRVAESDPAAYDLIVYRKGAWVLHMLRNLMLEFRTMKEDAFRAMIRDFHESYRGRRATTQNFITTVEKHFGQGMEWFFRQWLDGTAIPTYTLSWKADPAPGGRSVLKFKVRQENVPADFFMPVPLEIEFADGSRVYLRVNVRGTGTEGELPLPAVPTRLILNPLESVLAEIKTERWK